MARLPTNNRKYQISHVWERSQEIARRVVLGQSNKQIAAELSITPQTVSYTRNSHLVMEIMGKMGSERDKEVKEISLRIKEMAPKALDLVNGALDGSIDGVPVPVMQRLKEANSILDRDGYKPITKVDSLHTSLTITGEDLIKIKERAAELAEQSSHLVEVEQAESLDIGVKDNGSTTGNSGEELSESGGGDSGSDSLEESIDETDDYLNREISRLNQD